MMDALAEMACKVCAAGPVRQATEPSAAIAASAAAAGAFGVSATAAAAAMESI